jgi:flagellar biosynthesis protein FliQ
MAYPKKLGDLCTPSLVYFVISVLAILISIFQNFGNINKYTLGNYSCRVPSTIVVFIVKIIYILFWTWVLNLICKDGHKGIAWLLVLLPFILLFVIMGIVLLNQG